MPGNIYCCPKNTGYDRDIYRLIKRSVPVNVYQAPHNACQGPLNSYQFPCLLLQNIIPVIANILTIVPAQEKSFILGFT